MIGLKRFELAEEWEVTKLGQLGFWEVRRIGDAGEINNGHVPPGRLTRLIRVEIWSRAMNAVLRV